MCEGNGLTHVCVSIVMFPSPVGRCSRQPHAVTSRGVTLILSCATRAARVGLSPERGT